MEASSTDDTADGAAANADDDAISEEVRLCLDADSQEIQTDPSCLANSCKRLVFEKEVTRISFHAFRSFSQLESVKICSLAMDIGMSAFQYSSLKSIDLSSCQILRLGPSVFEDCVSLEEIIFGKNCTLIELQNSTFRGCSTLKNIRIPATVKTIMENCFEKCTSLKEVELPNCLVGLEANVFLRCSSLECMEVPGSITRINKLAFFKCHSLKSVKLHEGLLSIADFCLGHCFALENIQIPTTVVTIGFSCFASCTSLVAVELPPLLKRIEDGVFSNCAKLKRVWVSPTVESIGYHTFRSCSSLVSLEIPQTGNLASVDTHALDGCTNLRNMALSPTANPSERIFSNNNCHKMIRRATTVDLLEALQNRFDGLAVHDLCYHNVKDLTIRELEDALAADLEHSFLRRDKLGLNLLQILFLSFHSKHEILHFLINKYPTMLIPDSFGARLTIDLNVHRSIDDLCQLDELSVIQNVLEVSLSHRVQMLGLQQWKNNISYQIGSLASASRGTSNGILRILSNVESYERLETTSLLELAVWKAALIDVNDAEKRITLSEREKVRLTNGSNVIIPQATAFLWDVDVD